jgi:predicted ATP-grasp superfamily ATP-dependent carboligase
MMATEPLPPCLILAEQSWGGPLQAMRSLGARGVPVFVAVMGPGADVYRSSRFCSGAAEFSALAVHEFCEDVRRWFEREAGNGGPVLVVPTSDRLVEVLHGDRDSFGERFHLVIPDAGVLPKLLVKPESFEIAMAAGLSVPPWRRVTTRADVDDCARLELPVVIRPVAWRSVGAEYFKIIVVRERAELNSTLERLVDSGADLVVQQHVGGPEAVVEFAIVWRSADRDSTAVCTGKKRRQTSDDGGVMVWGSTVAMPAVRAATMDFLDRSGFTGVGGAEFIRSGDERWFIEFNPRLEAIHFIAAAAGLDTVVYLYCDRVLGSGAMGIPEQGPATAWIGSAWWQRLRSHPSSVGEAVLDRVRFAISPHRVRAVWSWHDPGPSVRVVERMVRAAVDKRQRSSAIGE